jgi:RNA polymerase sigma-70 factor (ECF subfamily)
MKASEVIEFPGIAERRAALMSRYCDGDEAAFAPLYQLLARPLWVYLVRLERDRPTAEDLLQQTFLKLHSARARYVRDADPLPWLYTIAHRTWVDEARRRKRTRPRLRRDSPAPMPEIPAGLTGERLADSDAEPFDHRLMTAVLAAMESLPGPQRQALVLTKIEGLSVAEAARAADTTIAALKVRAHRGCAALRGAVGASRPLHPPTAERGEPPLSRPSTNTLCTLPRDSLAFGARKLCAEPS